MGMPLMQQPALQTPAKTAPKKFVTVLSWLLARHRRRTYPSCPICTEHFYLGDCAIVKAGKLDNRGFPTPKSPPPTGSWHILWERIRPKTLKGPEVEHDDERRQCPKCGEVLPRYFERATNYIIGVIGATDVGKTVYLRQLFIDFKRMDILDALGASKPTLEIPDTNQWGDLEKDISEPFLPNQRKLKVKPFVFSMEVESHRVFSRNRLINLFFYDVPGESTVKPDTIRDNFPQLLEADGLILLADPELMPHVLANIPPDARSDVVRLNPRGLIQKMHAPDILHNVHDQLLNRGRRRWYDRKLRLPVAITISKSDLLTYTIKSPPHQRMSAQPQAGISARTYDFLEDRKYPELLDRDAFDKTSEHVRQFLEDVGESELAGKHRGLARYRYFAVAATGCPKSSDGKFKNPQPRRVADPVLWILLQLRVIDNNVYMTKKTGKKIVHQTGAEFRDALDRAQDWNERRRW